MVSSGIVHMALCGRGAESQARNVTLARRKKKRTLVQKEKYKETNH